MTVEELAVRTFASFPLSQAKYTRSSGTKLFIRSNEDHRQNEADATSSFEGRLYEGIESIQICFTVYHVAEPVPCAGYYEQPLVLGGAVLIVFLPHLAWNEAVVSAVDEE